MDFHRNDLPVEAGPNQATLTPPALAAQEVASPRKKILVVDDDPIILKTVSFKLMFAGYHVFTASDCSQAISVLRGEKPDLMLVDICFPPDVANGGVVRWDGFALTQWLRYLTGAWNLPVVFISDADRAEYKKQASALGAAAFFCKPIDHDRLLACIGAALSGNTGGNPAKPATVLPIPSAMSSHRAELRFITPHPAQ